MMPLEQLAQIAHPSPSRIVLLVVDGLGGLPHPQTGKTELETADTPNLDRLAQRGSCGLLDPVAPGITPGSAPGHLALFGYDPLTYQVGRGVVETLGIDFDLQPGDIAARGNFCTVDERGILVDRRAGRLPTEENARLCRLLSGITLNGAQLFVLPVKEHRFALVLRGQGLTAELADTDPQHEGLSPLPSQPLSPAAENTARLVTSFVSRARELLSAYHPANMILLRGFSQLPRLPSMNRIFKLNPAAIASYPMYRGLSKVVGMTVLPAASSLEGQFRLLEAHFPRFDYFFIHIKQADLAGEDGDFERKVKAIEEVDSFVPRIMELKPEVLAVTADHSTPAVYKAHSWHPVPLVIASPWCRADGLEKFSERGCAQGGLGRMAAVQLMTLLLAHAGKLSKFGG